MFKEYYCEGAIGFNHPVKEVQRLRISQTSTFPLMNVLRVLTVVVYLQKQVNKADSLKSVYATHLMP